MTLKEKIKKGLAIAGLTGVIGSFYIAYDVNHGTDRLLEDMSQHPKTYYNLSFVNKDVDLIKEMLYGIALNLSSNVITIPYGLSLIKKRKKEN